MLEPYGSLESHRRGSVAPAVAECPRRSPVLRKWRHWPLWRVSTTPARGAEFAEKLPPGAQLYYDWAGGLIWIALPPSHSAGAATIRRAAASTGGHATLIRASAATRAAVDVFEPQRGALAAVTRRVKESFDPKGVLNPGRMWAGV